MTTQNIGLFKALAAKMNYLDQRQRLIAQNIANADTPDYRPKDLLPVDFGRVLGMASGDNILEPVATDPHHLPMTGEIPDPKSRKQKTTYEVAPAGNAVIMEEQMVKSTQVAMDYNLITSLYQKNINMIRTALDRGQ